MSQASSITLDAKEFGRHFKQGGWRLGLLVARNVKAPKEGRPSKSDTSTSNGKVTQTEFAKRAGVSQATVSIYYRAWELQAHSEAGGIRPASELNPGDDEDLSIEQLADTEEEREKLWKQLYNRVKNADKPKEPKTPKPVAKKEISQPDVDDYDEDLDNWDDEESQDEDEDDEEIEEYEIADDDRLLDFTEGLRALIAFLRGKPEPENDKEIARRKEIARLVKEIEELTKEK